MFITSSKLNLFVYVTNAPQPVTFVTHINRMGNFVRQINTGPTACDNNTAEFNSKTNGQAMVITLISFVTYIAWNIFCYVDIIMKHVIYKCNKKNVTDKNCIIGSKLLSTASLSIITTGVGGAVALVTCFTQPIVEASFVISLGALVSAVSWLSTHGFTEHITLASDVIAIGLSAYVVGIASTKYKWEKSNNPIPNLYLALGIYIIVIVVSIVSDCAEHIEKKKKKYIYVLVIDPDDTGSSNYLILRERTMCKNYKSNNIKTGIVLILCTLASIVLLTKQIISANNVIQYLSTNPLPTYNVVYIATPIVGSVVMAINALSAFALFVEIVLMKINDNASLLTLIAV